MSDVEPSQSCDPGLPASGGPVKGTAGEPQTDELIFLMGKYEARFPRDRQYVASHWWLQSAGDNYRAGLTAYAVRLLQDVYFLDWTIDPETAVRPKQEIGQIESSKAVSSLYAPLSGMVISFNPVVLKDPAQINLDNYGQGWLLELALPPGETGAGPLSAEQYLAELEATWDATQRMLKSQYNA